MLNIYLGTTAISLIVTNLYSRAVVARMMRDGYKVKTRNKSTIERVVDMISLTFKICIPVFNIANTIFLLYIGLDGFYDDMIKKLLKDGTIYKSFDGQSKNDLHESCFVNENTEPYQNHFQSETAYQDADRFQYGTDGKMYDTEIGYEVIDNIEDTPKTFVRKQTHK